MTSRQAQTYRHLVNRGLITEEQLYNAYDSAEFRDVDLEDVLMNECGVPKEALLEALSEEFGFESIEFDERLPVPEELLEGLGRERERLAREPMFPMMLDGNKVVAALNDPSSPVVREEIDRFVHGPYTLRVAPVKDVLWFLQDYLNDRPGRIIGTERTGLAYWRNNMATWRTRMAAYRNNMAHVRSWQALVRWGLGLVTLAAAFVALDWNFVFSQLLYWLLLAAGLGMAGVGIWKYARLRHAMRRMPGPQTLAEVTAATVSFLEKTCQLEGAPRACTKATMLSRLGDFLPSYSTVLRPVPESRERTHLARERNVLAAQRTMAACYRTIYARARTGLGFIRTGIVFLSIGVGLTQLYHLGAAGLWGVVLGVAGLAMAVDGLIWYIPARKEEPDLQRMLSEPAPLRYENRTEDSLLQFD